MAANTVYSKRKNDVCMVTLGLFPSKRVALKCYVLYWRGGLQLDSAALASSISTYKFGFVH